MISWRARYGALAVALVSVLGVSAGPVWADDPALAAQREQAEAQRKALQGRIDAVRADVQQAEQRQDAAQTALQAAEQALSAAGTKVAEAEAEQARVRAALGTLDGQLREAQTLLDARQAALAELARRQYVTGGTGPWQALLSGDDPQESGRTLAYMGYVSRLKSDAIEAVVRERRALAALHAEQASQASALARAVRVAEEAQAEQVRNRAARQTALKEVQSQIETQQAALQRLERDEARLGRLVDGIVQAIAEQARQERERLARERAAREREAARQAALAARQAREQVEAARRAEQARAEQARAEARQRAASGPTATLGPATPPGGEAPAAGVAERPQVPEDAARVRLGAAPEVAAPAPAPTPAPTPAPDAAPRQPRPEDAIEADVNPHRVEARSQALPQPDAAAPEFPSLRGRLRLPVRGDVIGRFGQPRPGGGTWRGAFIRTGGHDPVHAVAAGQVVFAGWLRGFGNLVIVDHGHEYLSVYGNNDSVQVSVGDVVAAGDRLGAAGQAGVSTETGIYFELRHRGQPVDPLQWAGLR